MFENKNVVPIFLMNTFNVDIKHVSLSCQTKYWIFSLCLWLQRFHRQLHVEASLESSSIKSGNLDRYATAKTQLSHRGRPLTLCPKVCHNKRFYLINCLFFNFLQGSPSWREFIRINESPLYRMWRHLLMSGYVRCSGSQRNYILLGDNQMYNTSYGGIRSKETCVHVVMVYWLWVCVGLFPAKVLYNLGRMSDLEFHLCLGKAISISLRALPLENLKVYGKILKGQQGQDQGKRSHGLRCLQEIPGLECHILVTTMTFDLFTPKQQLFCL